jgi:hypothetical protein
MSLMLSILQDEVEPRRISILCPEARIGDLAGVGLFVNRQKPYIGFLWRCTSNFLVARELSTLTQHYSV